MAWTDPATPNVADFTKFAGDQFTAAQLPVNSPWIGYALDYSLARVSTAPGIAGPQYTLAVYCLALHWLIKWTPDQNSQTAFVDARKKYNLSDFVGGIISGSSDTGSASTLSILEGLKDMPLAALDCLKTPWGRAYLEYQQSFGPRIFGVS